MNKKMEIVATFIAAVFCGLAVPVEAQSTESPGSAPTSTITTDPNADNTAKNVRDQDPSSSTPLDQGTSDSDVRMTKEIRRRILKIKELSINAQNIKIITNHGHVVLRGPVNSREEFQRVSEIASKVAGVDNVRNELEVKTNS